MKLMFLFWENFHLFLLEKYDFDLNKTKTKNKKKLVEGTCSLHNPIYNYKHGVCVSVCPSFTYLLLIFFSLTSFRFHYLSGVIPLASVPCGVFWGVGEGRAQ
jgi:hypothetical protein